MKTPNFATTLIALISAEKLSKLSDTEISWSLENIPESVTVSVFDLFEQIKMLRFLKTIFLHISEIKISIITSKINLIMFHVIIFL